MKVRRLVKAILQINLLKTIVFNFKMLPFKTALKLPVVFCGKTEFRSLSGKIVFKGPIYTGMIKVGPHREYVYSNVQKSVWTIKGTVVFGGPVIFRGGSYVLVAPNALLEIDSRPKPFKFVSIGANTKIICYEHIKIGYQCVMAWECQLYDTNFHYIEYTDPLKEKEITSLVAPILIGNNTWIGNRCTISKGAVIPDWSIVAANSLVNKDFTENGSNCLFAGSPARMKASGLRRIFDSEIQKQLDEKFHYNRCNL